MSCKITLGQLSRRMQLKVYSGPAATAVGSSANYTYAVSDPVPQGKYWLVYAASLLHDTAGANANDSQGALYLLFPNAKVPLNTAPYKQQSIFLSHNSGASDPTTICNGGPVDPQNSIRIEETVNLDTVTHTGIGTPFEQALLRSRKPFIVPELCTLMAHDWYVAGDGGVLSEFLTLKLLVAQMDQTESVEI